MPIAVTWKGLEEGVGGWRAELATIELDDDGVRAEGTQIGADPLPYRADYVLDAGRGFTTAQLEVYVTGAGWSRDLVLTRDAGGTWVAQTRTFGDVDLPAPAADTALLRGALDCDLAFSPLTNLMPVRRHQLDRRPGREDIAVAWVSLPDLAVHRSQQRYEHLADGSVRFTSLDDDESHGFTADLRLDRHGLVVEYPQLARRVVTGARVPPTKESR
ncbi:hypothetical protein PAI11_08820 [Patulibacter medicamentivorans]|uniref:Glycolipid-binding domain-containing protein n=1 Tax=Patulibacter medicamentivorans TaxID=1097667 RepID=H0E269_9ACTN|nr:putative glycolipid-binding domain-containing protein [Patulibacter medicamentivorans]EHN12206.1 hypothetical protein PAI11_08820 [Patulibacter medicamentivorans]